MPEPKIIREKRILVVEDEPTVRDSLAMLLSVDDHHVTEASNGAEALTLFTNRDFDVVMTDFEMPIMKGNELAVRIKRLKPQQPIIMVTAFAEKITSENPVDVIINKPFRLEDLRQAISSVFPCS